MHLIFFYTNLIFHYLWPNPDGIGYDYFNVFCALAIFIIIGIGADDIFVFNDIWIESGRHKWASLAHRLSHAYMHAGKAMLVTSATTSISFFTNMTSPFVGTRAFGTFAGALFFARVLGD